MNIAIKPISCPFTSGPVLPARAASNPRETQVVMEYEYQYIMATSANKDSPNPLTVEGVRHFMDLRIGSDWRHRLGSTARNVPRRKVNMTE